MSFGSTSLDNITVNTITTEIIAISFTLYSENISYPEIPLVEVNQLVPQARVEWIPVWQRLQEVVAMSEFIITDGIEEYESIAVWHVKPCLSTWKRCVNCEQLFVW